MRVYKKSLTDINHGPEALNLFSFTRRWSGIVIAITTTHILVRSATIIKYFYFLRVISPGWPFGRRLEMK